MGALFRLIVDGERDGAANLAVDEAILDRYVVSPPDLPPTLRLYSWSPAALSLGAKQPAAGAHDPEWLRANGVDLVRRPTGGRAVLHDRERTYAVAGRLHAPPFPGGVLDTYARIGEALVRALRSLGLPARPASAGSPGSPSGFPVCFDRPGASEIVVDGRKVVGSAQVRRRGAFLQHGSILLRAEAPRWSAAIGVAADPSAFAGVEDLLGRPLAPGELDEAVAAGFREALGAECREGELTDAEAGNAARLRCWKYDSIAWTIDGRIGERELRWGGLGDRRRTARGEEDPAVP